MTTSRVTTDHLALPSDGMKYTRITEGEDAYRDWVVKQELYDTVCLSDKHTGL